MPSELYISNEELSRRLKAHNYNAPPVTASTRSVLLKKLQTLEDDKKQRTKVVRGIMFLPCWVLKGYKTEVKELNLKGFNNLNRINDGVW